MLHIVFEYADAMSNWELRKQECIVSSMKECIRIYGLYDPSVNYRIISVEEIVECKGSDVDIVSVSIRF